MRISILCLFIWVLVFTNTKADACTSIVVGVSASSDGSVMTSHTCDSHWTGSDIHVRKRGRHKTGALLEIAKRKKVKTGAMEHYEYVSNGKIPQVKLTYGYLAPAYPAMNEHQVAIGESTFGGRKELQSNKGKIDCQALCKLILERAKTARQGIKIAGELLQKHGWNDEGEVLTITDTKEAWQLEIVGPGNDKVGAVWAAQRIPDGHVGVVANRSRIRTIDISKPDEFMASKNVSAVAKEKGWWDPKKGKPFEFCAAYDPANLADFAGSRREWRVFDLLAPSLKLDPNANSFPFSVKPDKKVSPKRVMELFRDTFEGTDYDVVKNLTVVNEDKKTVISPVANPFMPYDMNKMLKINGGWGWRGERALARWYCMYATVTQSRSWLPNPIGGLLWFGYDNPAMTMYVPIYVGVKDIHKAYKTNGRATGFSRKSAWWAFNRVSTIAGHRWKEMRKDVAKVRDDLQTKAFQKQKLVEKKALKLYKQNPKAAQKFLTKYSKKTCDRVAKAYWDLGDLLWTKYDEMW